MHVEPSKYRTLKLFDAGRLVEQMAAAGNDDQISFALRHLVVGALIGFDAGAIAAANHKERGSAHKRELLARKIGGTTPADDCLHIHRPARGGDDRSGGSASNSNIRHGQLRLIDMDEFVGRHSQAMGQKLWVEAIAACAEIDDFFAGRQNIQKKSAVAMMGQIFGQGPIMSAVPGAAAAVNEDDTRSGVGWLNEFAMQLKF